MFDKTSPLSSHVLKCWRQTKIHVLSINKIIHHLPSLPHCTGTARLLHILVPRQAEADFSLIDLLQGRRTLVCCGEKQCGLRRPACARVCLSASGREKLFSLILQGRGARRGFSTGGTNYSMNTWLQINRRELEAINLCKIKERQSIFFFNSSHSHGVLRILFVLIIC